MIGYLSGKVLSRIDGGFIIENNGIGYEVVCSAAAQSRLERDKEGGIFTYLQVRDDGLYLYGFDTAEEKKMFLKLITVSGVGPKMGISVLSSLNITDLAMAIATSDVKSLSKIKGCGKKTAERIILELRGSMVDTETGEIASGVSTALVSEDEDAVIALMGLGFSGQESRNAVKTARDGGAARIEDVIAAALRNLK